VERVSGPEKFGSSAKKDFFNTIDPSRTCKSDVLWQNDGGQARPWQMNDARFSSETRRGSVFHPSIALDQWFPKMSA
jgi:hypothetical protein